MDKFADQLPEHVDRTEQHMVEVWLHELQDHTNLIAELPDTDPSAYLRAAFYTGYTQGLNGNKQFLVDMEKTPRTHGSVTFATMDGFDAGEKFKLRLEMEDRLEYRQKMVLSLKDKLTKITPWEDQTRKPL